MDLQLTEEQTLLAESADELAARGASWEQLVEFGALEAGDEIGAVELALVARSLGRKLAALPFPESAALAYAGAGGGRAAICLAEPGRSFDAGDAETTGENGSVTGEKDGVAFASIAEVLAVSIAGPALVLVDPAARGVVIEPAATLDPSLETARVLFDSASGEVVDADVLRLAAAAGVLVSAEAVGAAAELLGLACEYAAQRKQFGQTIGSFQAIRHLLADMYVKVESSWSSVLYAAAALDEREPDALQTASIAKAYAGRATHDVAHGALQVFGGIAFTAEHPAHRFLRRIVVRGSQFGSAREHERSIGRAFASTLVSVV
jgi:alkylation response protein AidB-like acyl-CoA dehydrogenase